MKKQTLILILTLTSIFVNIHSQSISTDYTDEDFNAAFELLGLSLYKIDFAGMKENTYIKVTIDEHIPDSIINSKTYNFYPSKVKENQSNEIKVYSKRASYNSETIWLNIVHPSMHVLNRLDLDEQFRDTHFWRNFEPGGLEYERKIPVLVYGMAWEVTYPSGVTLMKFCPDNLHRDLSNEAFKKMNHYYIISYELNDTLPNKGSKTSGRQEVK